MASRNTPVWLTLTNIVVLALVGCAHDPKFLPEEGPTSMEVYDNHLLNSVEQTDGQTLDEHHDDAQDQRDPTEWSLRVDHMLSVKFPEIPNIELQGFVYPHLTANGHPVPGYPTHFWLYDQHHYALPGEVVPESDKR